MLLEILEVDSFVMDVNDFFVIGKYKKFMFLNVRKDFVSVNILDFDIFIEEEVRLFGKLDYLGSLGDFMDELVDVEKVEKRF